MAGGAAAHWQICGDVAARPGGRYGPQPSLAGVPERTSMRLLPLAALYAFAIALAAAAYGAGGGAGFAAFCRGLLGAG